MKAHVLTVGPPELSADEVQARFAWARAAGHPDYVWPELPIAEWRRAVRSVAQTIATGLCSARDPARAARLSARDAVGIRALGVAGYTTGTAPLLGYWIETGQIAADPEISGLLRLHLDHARRRAARVDVEVGRATSVLADAGIRPAVIKGTHTAHVYFPDPGTRPCSDIDLVVAPGQLDAAGAVLAKAGYEPGRAEPHLNRHTWWPTAMRRVPHSLEMVHADDPCSIDLHDSFERPFGGTRRVSVVDDMRMLRPWPRYGAVDVLTQPGLTAQLALHASEAFRSLTLIRLVELLFVLRRDQASGVLTLGGLCALLEERRALAYVYPVFAMLERLVPGTVEAGFLAVLHEAAPRRVRRMFEHVRPDTMQRLERVSVEEWFMWTRGPIEHARRAFRWLWAPSAHGSWSELPRLYVRRLHRLRHGRIRVRRG